jgi:hypothetical protein
LTKSSEVEVSTITDSKKIDLPKGEYTLVFQTGLRNNEMWCEFTFYKKTIDEWKILKADSEITVNKEFDLSYTEA